MKGMFPEYESGQKVDYDAIWNDAVFVFDTNVLLNLYRYRVATREELLAVLDKISARIWIPYQVALEFQRNRLKVIAEQIKRFSEVKRTVDKAKSGLSTELAKLKLQERHSLINPEPLISGFEKLVEDFYLELKKLENDQQTLNGADALKNRLEVLFDSRVGPGFTKQEQVDALQKQGEQRYKFKIPPGYEDDSKDSKDSDEFMHRGLVYKAKYGDFIIWKQTLEHCKNNAKKSLVFVTDDAKEDWWRILDLDGPKTIGPRVELIDEAKREGGVENFLVYSPSVFLAYAKKTLQATVSDDTLEEVKKISFAQMSTRRRELFETSMRAQVALKRWLSEQPDIQILEETRNKIVAVSNGVPSVYLISVSPATTVKNPFNFTDRTRLLVADYAFSNKANIGNVVVVWIASNLNMADQIKKHVLFNRKKGFEMGVQVWIATLDNPETFESGFFLHSELSL